MVQGNHNEDIINFYGVLVDIIQLDYVRDKVVLLFKCDWYDVDKRRSRILQDGALTSVRVDRLWYLSDPFVLATQANQVFYINDPKLGLNWRVVHHFNHRHIFTGECEIDNNEDDMEWNDDAYQDEELSNEVAGVRELGNLNIMGPGLPKKNNRSLSQSNSQRENASSLPKKKALLDAPRPIGSTSMKDALASTNPVMPTPSPRTPIMATPSPTMPSPTTLNLGTQNVETTGIPSVDNQEESPNDTRGSVAGENDEELMDQNEDIQFSKKRVRGLTRGVGLYKRNRSAAKKLEVEIDPVFGRCLQIDHGTKVANELGQIAPAYLWPIRKDKEVREAIFGDVLLKLQGKLTIKNIRNTAVQEKLWQHFLLIVRGKRGRFRAIYRLHGDATKSHRPSNVSEATWNSLCDYWDDEDVQTMCEKNKINRKKVKKPHTEGPVSFVSSFHEMKEKRGGNYNLVEFWKKSHTKKSGAWSSTECQTEYEKMQNMVDASKETEHPIEPNDAFLEILGTGHGYIKGLGYGPTPPSKRKKYLETENEELRELNNKLVEENHQLQEKCVELEGNVTELKARQEASEARHATADAKIAASDAKYAELEKLVHGMLAKNGGI
ncbi:hypothetical protein LINGRAHAP2_LOCUS6423 [Linum grandiflorum]